VTLLPTMLVLIFILSDAHSCSSCEKFNYCKIRNSITKNYYIIW